MGFLVLTRRNGEAITITAENGDDIQIRVTKVQEGAARISINAPLSYSIARDNCIKCGPKDRSTT